jgi:arginine decarboxylase-like protein
MEDWKNAIQKELDRVWPKTQKNIAKINKEVSKLLKESEKNIAHFSKSVKKGAEKLVSKARREQLYYELGKAVSRQLTSDQLKDKEILRISTELQTLNKKLRSSR